MCDEKWLHRWHWLLSSAGKGGNSRKNAAVPPRLNQRRVDWQPPGLRMPAFSRLDKFVAKAYSTDIG